MDQETKDKLTALLGDCVLASKTSANPDIRTVQYMAINALGTTGGEAATQMLVRLAKDPDPFISEQAIQTLYSLE